ncbi:MAG: Vps62-related protein [Nitrososphaerales archaeon]
MLLRSNKRDKRFYPTLAVPLLLGVLLTANLLIIQVAEAQNIGAEQNLAAVYAPKLHFTRGEKFYPTSVEYVITSSTLRQRIPGGDPRAIDGAPRPSTLGEYTATDLYLNNKLGTFQAIATDYAAKAQQTGYYAYVHIVDNGKTKIIQYWLLYVYNNGRLNDHQGDWEVIEVFIDESGMPSKVLLSQHSAGENADWANVEKHQTTHPVVYVAQGSHANYFRSYQGKIGIESDIVGNDGLVIEPENLNLLTLGERGSHPSDQSWLDFRGRWGYWGSDEEVVLGMAGPLGPVDNQDGIRWARPNVYLHQSFAVDTTYFYLAWIAANFLLLFITYMLVRAAWKIVSIIRLMGKGDLLVVRFLRSRGGIGVILGIMAILITIGALSMPWYYVTASSATGPLANQGEVELVTVDGINGLKINFFLDTGDGVSSGYQHVFSTQVPFSIMIAAGLVLLILDIIGVVNPRTIGRKFIFGAVTAITPFIVIYFFIMMLPSVIQLAPLMIPSQSIPSQVDQVVNTISASPIIGRTSQMFPTLGTVTVNWGFGVGAYLFIFAAVVRIIAGAIVGTAPEIRAESLQLSTA